MKLPNAEYALVEREKVADYLLNVAHRYGASKAVFSKNLGFGWTSGSNWRMLRVSMVRLMK